MPRLTSSASLILAAGCALAAPWSALAQQAGQTESLETVVVTAQRIREQLDAERDLTPGSVTVLDGADSYKRSVTNLADLLRYVPGVWSESRNGTDEVFYSSRGSNLDATDYDKNGIKMLQDGLPVTTADGNNHNRALDPLSARYATIAHGANALTYGASTLGGAIDFTSPTARNSAPLALFLSGGSFGQFSGRASAGASTEKLDGLVTAEARNVDGYRDHGSQDSKGVYANAGWKSSDAVSSRVYATWLDNRQLLPGALTRSQYDADPEQANPAAINADYKKNVETWRLAAKTTWTIDGRSSLEVGLSYEEQSLYHPIVDRIMIDFDGPGPAPPVEVFSLLVDTDHRDLGASLRYNFRVGDHDLLAGINFGDGAVTGGNYRNLGGRPNGLTEVVDQNADTLEVFLVDRWRLAPAWTLTYGAQLVEASRDVRTTDANSGEVRNPNVDYSAFNPRVGVIHALSARHELFASVSRLYEAPTSFELEDDVRGSNATLDAMHGTVYEMGLRGASAATSAAHWNWDVSVYYAQIRDEILSVDDPAAPGNSLTTNIDRTTHAGIEALLGASFALGGMHSIEPLVSVTLNDFSFDGDPVYGDNDLPAAPAYAVRGEVMYRNARGFHVGPTFDLIGERYADFVNSYRIGSYGLLGVRGGFSGEGWEVFAELRNLLDRKYVANVGVQNEAAPDAAILYPGAPISAYAGLRMSF
jgi:iron complex outermembrane recepter protein